MHYLRLTLILVVTLAGVFVSSLYVIDHLTAATEQSTTAKQDTIKSYASDLALAQDAAKRLLAIKQVQSSQTRFSVLLDELAKVTPKGTSIDSITLTGDDNKPVRISVTSGSYDAVLNFRDDLAKSSLVSGVDLENIGNADTIFHASMVIGFKIGQLK